ncbi:GNAT family N-acetyltransferase [Guptibacillus hwajinpoensis]|uniref:RimJ/RimL family protein N-acetyltransferase n=1 Tax=Guptibacillus hwajinpoensis TaxID=208199 RepID=A0ABU0K1V6_9BACL|nr:GNAT family protein [Alkalihalobacillus hemicentroti]MDQ0483332.1 RimJ/RimL family protein N-acetyltransferase [Alkalihalobacillus hemicentroti]
MIELRYFEPNDFQQLLDWIPSQDFLLQWGGPGFTYPLTVSQLETYVNGANKDDSSVFVYKVIHIESGNVIGHISLGKLDKTNKSARIGKVLVGDNDVRGQGIGQRMIEELLKIAFNEFALHRVSLGVFDFNQSAIRCYEKAGFTKEGLLRDYRKNDNEYWSLWEMSILKHEWLAKQ